MDRSSETLFEFFSKLTHLSTAKQDEYDVMEWSGENPGGGN
jgi:hypothetical protein